MFLVAAFAEAARLPFDLPEAEQELIGGYHTEYSGMKLMLFLIAEFLHMVVAAFLIVILFFGGWHFWGMPAEVAGESIGWPLALARLGIMLAKVMLVILFFMMVRWSWPRFRFDQLMNLAWKVMLPLGLVNLVAVAVGVRNPARRARAGRRRAGRTSRGGRLGRGPRRLDLRRADRPRCTPTTGRGATCLSPRRRPASQRGSPRRCSPATIRRRRADSRALAGEGSPKRPL